jgi:hypothetical protein
MQDEQAHFSPSMTGMPGQSRPIAVVAAGSTAERERSVEPAGQRERGNNNGRRRRRGRGRRVKIQ